MAIKPAYGAPHSPPGLLPSMVCYADMLGYKHLAKNAITSGDSQGFLERIHRTLSDAYSRMTRRSSYADTEHFSLKVFTDNVVVGYPMVQPREDLGEPELGSVFSIFSEFQLALALDGFLVRGGIASGYHYQDGNVVFGPAFLEAVEADQQGGAPRLALTPSAVDLVRHHVGWYSKLEETPHWADLLQDADGTVFLNYLDLAFAAVPDDAPFYDALERHRAVVVAGLAQYRDHATVRSKYQWAATYHDFVCGDFVERYSPPEVEEPDAEDAAWAEAVERVASYMINDKSSSISPPHRLALEPIRPRRAGS
jgi:hypothetical protein